MAARTRKVVLDERWRERIRTSMLINRLQDHVFNDTEMSQTQIRAVEILLKKVAPDLSAAELTGKDGAAIAVSIKDA
jgi:hypothetical protein